VAIGVIPSYMTGMMRRVPPFLLLSLLLAPGAGTAAPGCPSVTERLAPLLGVQAELDAGEPLTIVALGSSSTEGAGASTPEAAYPNRLEALLRGKLPGVELNVVNAGKSGETSQEMLARLEADVLAHDPDLVIWQAGGNEVLLGRDPATFLDLMRQGLRRLRAAGVEVVLMDNQQAPRILGAPAHARFEAAMRALAEEERVPLFARSRLMRRWQEAGLPQGEVIAPDGLHHNDRGYACLAEALAAALLRSAGQREAQLASN
jgi:lysophospholipase L1-like esterase